MIELLLKVKTKTNHKYIVDVSRFVSSLIDVFVESIINLDVSDCYRM
jgi:hypothetical protein